MISALAAGRFDSRVAHNRRRGAARCRSAERQTPWCSSPSGCRGRTSLIDRRWRPRSPDPVKTRQWARKPPSTTSSVPVTNDESLPAKNALVLGRSRMCMHAARAAFPGRHHRPIVLVHRRADTPGQTALTRMFFAANSSARSTGKSAADRLRLWPWRRSRSHPRGRNRRDVDDGATAGRLEQWECCAYSQECSLS